MADIAPKVGAFDGDRGVGITKSRRPATTEMSLSNLCRWNECSQNPLAGSLFCTAHVADIIREPLENFLPFLKNLTRVVNNETAGNALYHAVHAAVHMGMFNSHVGHDLVRAARACRDGNGVAAVVEKLAAAIGAQEQGEFMMHVKRQLVVPERRSARRE